VLSDDEIRQIWKVCEDWEAETLELRRKGQKRSPGGYVVPPDYARAVQLLFLTGLRAQEIGDLHWSEVHLDDREIVITKERMKNGKPLCVPLADMAVDILRRTKAETEIARPKDPCVFGRGDGETVIKDGIKWKEGLFLGDTVAKIEKRFKRGPIGFWRHVMPPDRMKRIRYAIAARISGNQIMRQEEISHRTLKAIERGMKAGEPIPEAQPEMPHWRMHDIRRTMRTSLSRCGVSRDIAERLIGHRPVDITDTEEAYDLHEYWSQKEVAVKKWQDLLTGIIDGTAEETRRPKNKPIRKAA
jgi:integrase